MRPFVRDILEHNGKLFLNTPLVSLDDLTDNMMRSLLSTNNVVFVKVPTVEAPTWPEHIKKRFFSDVQGAKDWHDKRPESDWIYMELEGTTFSGHSTRTTLGNTIRSLMYCWFYIQ
jgi:hypothetical protein